MVVAFSRAASLTLICNKGVISKMSATNGIIGIIRTPLGAVLMLVVTLILAGLSIAAAISGELTAAAVSAAGLVVIVLLLTMINLVGK